jgi:hypothetical protein
MQPITVPALPDLTISAALAELLEPGPPELPPSTAREHCGCLVLMVEMYGHRDGCTAVR